MTESVSSVIDKFLWRKDQRRNFKRNFRAVTAFCRQQSTIVCHVRKDWVELSETAHVGAIELFEIPRKLFLTSTMFSFFWSASFENIATPSRYSSILCLNMDHTFFQQQMWINVQIHLYDTWYTLYMFAISARLPLALFVTAAALELITLQWIKYLNK